MRRTWEIPQNQGCVPDHLTNFSKGSQYLKLFLLESITPSKKIKPATWKMELWLKVKGYRLLMRRRTMGQVYCTRWKIPYRPSIFDIQGHHAPLRPCKTQRDKILAAMQVSLCIPLNPPPLARRSSWNVQVVNNYQDLIEVLNEWNIIHHSTSPCSQNATRQLSDVQIPN